MTGGSHSVSTPPDAVTATTPLGQLERPMDICGTAAVNGASFVARTTTFDGDGTTLMVRAIRNFERKRDMWGLLAVARAVADVDAYPVEALLEGVGDVPGRRAAVEAGLAL